MAAKEAAPVNEALPAMAALDANGEQQVPCNNSLPSPDHRMQISEASELTLLLEQEETAELLFRKGRDAINVCQFVEALDCLCRALEIRVKHHGELAPECLSTYYEYGRALFCKSIEDYDPFDEDESAPEIEETSDIADVHSEAGETCEVPDANTGKTSQAPQASETLSNSDSNSDASVQNEGRKDEKEYNLFNDDGIDVESEEESELDLAWKMFDIVRVILERNQQIDDIRDIFRMVEVYAALGDVSLERGNSEASFQDYCKALSYLEGVVRSDNRHIAELCYKICVALECADKATEALSYAQRAVSVCESRLHKLKNKIATLSNGSEASSNRVKVISYSKERGVITQLLIDYKEKVDELQRSASFPQLIESVDSSEVNNTIEPESNACTESILSKDRFDSPAKKADTSNFSSPSPSIIDLGIVGRGIKCIKIPV